MENEYVDCWLTTFDNPFDPFEQFEEWFDFDVDHDYNTCAYIDRVACLTDDLSEVEKDRKTEQAIDSIINYDFLNIYKKVTKKYIQKEVNNETKSSEIEQIN